MWDAIPTCTLLFYVSLFRKPLKLVFQPTVS